MLELAKFKNDQGIDTQVTVQDVKRVLCPNASDKEIGMFLSLCQSQRLDPFAGDVYLVKYGQNAQMITSKDVFVRRGNQNPNFEGFEAGVVVINAQNVMEHRAGSAFYPRYDKELIGGWCKVYVKGRKPYYDEVTIGEYSSAKGTWKTIPGTMIRKVAIVHAFREAFNFSGMYTAEEMNQAGVPEFDDSSAISEVADYAVEVEEPAPAQVPEAHCDLFLLEHKADQFAALAGRENKDVFNALAETKVMKSLGLKTWDEVTPEQVDNACAILDGWIAKKQEQKANEQEGN